MTVATSPIWRSGTGLARWAAILGFVLAILALLMLVAGPLGWRAGWWHYRIGLQTLMPDAGYVGLAAIAVSALALIFGARSAARGGLILAVLGLLIGGTAAYFPWHWSNQRGLYPPFNDVTTDLDNPPSLAFSEAARRAEHASSAAYGGPGVAALQKKSYPDIAPATLDLPPAQAFDRALAAAKSQGWTIVKTDPAAGTIDADEQSRWFGFTDDVAIRITPNGAGSRVDVRSASRQGRGDFAVNANRVRGFLAALREGSGR
jgi:uncharacterized protein (DUF1499 family)